MAFDRVAVQPWRPCDSNLNKGSPSIIAATTDVVNYSIWGFRAHLAARHVAARSRCSIVASAVPNTACAAIMTTRR